MTKEELETREKLKLLNIVKDKRIKELEKENKELNERICKVAENILNSRCKGDDPCPHLKKRDDQLIKAKDLLMKLSTCLEGHSNNNFEYGLIKEAEQFLNSEVEK